MILLEEAFRPTSSSRVQVEFKSWQTREFHWQLLDTRISSNYILQQPPSKSQPIPIQLVARALWKMLTTFCCPALPLPLHQSNTHKTGKDHGSILGYIQMDRCFHNHNIYLD